jgi:hypothetical protein
MFDSIIFNIYVKSINASINYLAGLLKVSRRRNISLARIRLVNSSLRLLLSVIKSRIVVLVGIIGIVRHSSDNGGLSINDLSGVIEGGVVKRSSSNHSRSNTSLLLGTAAADTDQYKREKSSTTDPLSRVGSSTIDGGIEVNIVRATCCIKYSVVIAHEIGIKDDGVGKRGRNVAFASKGWAGCLEVQVEIVVAS